MTTGQARSPRGLMARKIDNGQATIADLLRIMTLNWDYIVERVTGIEPALSVWEAEPSCLETGLTWQLR
jgi:hypothetical protein